MDKKIGEKFVIGWGAGYSKRSYHSDAIIAYYYDWNYYPASSPTQLFYNHDIVKINSSIDFLNLPIQVGYLIPMSKNYLNLNVKGVSKLNIKDQSLIFNDKFNNEYRNIYEKYSLNINFSIDWQIKTKGTGMMIVGAEYSKTIAGIFPCRSLGINVGWQF